MSETTMVLPEVEGVADDPAGLPFPPPPAPGERNDDDLSLTIGTRVWAGWDAVSVTRGIERMPSSFTISLTERYAGEADLIIVPGDECVVRLGRDTVLTGYVDRHTPSIDARQHTVTISGRGKCQDLSDCAAVWPTFQISGSTVAEVIRKLARPYGIEVLTPNGEGPAVPTYSIAPGETTWAVIEELTRFARFLAHEDNLGRLVLSRVGTERHASGIKQGVNMLSGATTFAADVRFSEYVVLTPSHLGLMQAAAEVGGAADLVAQAKDEGVKRFRRLIVMLEAGDGTGEAATQARQRAEWEAARRRGRGEAIRVTVDSWRDRAKKLWEPNTLVAINSAALKVNADWLISEVTYNRSEGGTIAELVLMPPSAFQPEYSPLIQSRVGQAAQELREERQRGITEGGGGPIP